MDKFHTKSGTEYDCPFFATIPNMQLAYIGVSGLSYVEAAALFSNATEMSEITFGSEILSGYTQLEYIMHESYGLKACLKKGEPA